MSCGRLRRELLWMSRFGELDSDSGPHLDHLAGCRGCRDAIGIDRLMVEQLRIALAERVADATPSPGAWEQILARAQAPRRGTLGRLAGWSARFVGLQRVATAIAGSGLALVLAINTEIVPVAVPVEEPEPVRAPAALDLGADGAVPGLFFAEEPARAEWVAGAVDPDQEPREDPGAAARAAAEASAANEQAVVELRISLRATATASPEGGGLDTESEGLATMPVVIEAGVPS